MPSRLESTQRGRRRASEDVLAAVGRIGDLTRERATLVDARPEQALAASLWLWWLAWLAMVFLLTVVAWLRRRRQLQDPEAHLSSPLPPGLGIAGVERFLAERDRWEAPLQPGVGSCVRWASGRGVATELAVVFLHGWSTSPEEIDPVDTELARRLGANLVRLRLTGHGLSDGSRPRGGDGHS